MPEIRLLAPVDPAKVVGMGATTPDRRRKPAMHMWTVGHSTHPIDVFVALPDAHDIAQMADIRTVPKSRRHPHLHTDELALSLPERGVAYAHLPPLGGWRHADANSPNGAWRSLSFRGYADYGWAKSSRTGSRSYASLPRHGAPP